MTPEQFCYWLQGYLDRSGDGLTQEQVDKIKDYLFGPMSNFEAKVIIGISALSGATVTMVNK